MKKVLIYILSILSLGMISSCAQDDPIEVAKNNRIVFVAEPTPYEGDGLPTKADENYETISSLYLLLFDNTTKGIVGDPIDMISETEYAYIHEQESAPDMTAFFLANFTSEFVNGLTLSDLEDDGVLSDLVASEVVDNCIKPANDKAITGIPMIGKRSITQEDLGKIRTIPLKRLFAKVDVRVVMGTSDQSFDLESCTLTNLPQEVRISELSDTWVASGFNDPITLADDINVTNEGYDLPTIYVPEHKPGISGTGQEQDKISASGNPLYLTLKGIYRRDANWSARVEYTIYLGGDNNTNFDLLRNHSYANVITINGVNSATTDKRVNYYGHNLADPTNSGTEDPANCYIISEPGRYMIPACKGNVLSETLTGDNSAVLANDNSSNSITNIQKVNFNDKDYIRFDVNLKNGTSTAVSDGNLVFQYGDWSWHLWLCSDVPGDHVYPKGSGGESFTIMARNLGADPDTQIGIEAIGTTDFHPVAGVYYQWGDKDPFFKSSTGTSDYHGGTNADTWSADAKSLTDPCPPGYMIPTSEVWTNGMPADEITRYFVDGSFLYSEDFSEGEVIRYPFSSYLNDSKTKVAFNKVSDGPHTTAPRKDESGVFKYNFTLNYSGTYQYKFGRLHARDMAIHCEYNYYEVDASSLKYSGTFTVTISGYTATKSVSNLTQQQLNNYEVKVTVKIFGISKTISLGKLGDIANSLGYDLDEICQELFSSIKNNNAEAMDLKKLSYGTGTDQMPKTNGAQIRCQRIE